MIALIDCNNFYVSCERMFHPGLKNKPVIVLSNNDGCTVARSEEAKALGIRMGTPAFAIQPLIQKHGVRVFSSNYTLYGDMSARVMQLIKEFVPRTEVYSIDEIFADLTGLPIIDLTGLAKQIRETVMRCTGIPVSVGIAATKTLAKMANDQVKKQRLPGGVLIADSDHKTTALLQGTAVQDIWGIGEQHAGKLRKQGVLTAADFLTLPEQWVRREMAVVGLRTQMELRGIQCIQWEEGPAAKKNICTSHSFGKLITSKRELQQAIATFTSACAQKLRKQNSCARKVHVFVQTNIHRSEDRQYFHSINLDIPVATNNTTELIKYTMTALNRIYQPGYNYYKTGVMVMDLVSADQIQLGLFDTCKKQNEGRLMQAMDKVNSQYGQDLVRPARQEFNKKWRLRQEHLSKRDTTQFNELAIVKAS